MAQITVEMQTTAQVAPAQVGKGQAVHYVSTAEFTADTQCGRQVARVLLDREATGTECTRCVKKVQALIAAQAPTVEEPAAPAPVRAPAKIKPLAEDVTTPATMFDPELTYYADGTDVIMRWTGGEKSGTTAGMTVDRGPYAYQAVQFEDGTTSNVAPHVLHRVAPPALGGVRYVAEWETVLTAPDTRVHRITVKLPGHDAPVFTKDLMYDPDVNAGQTLAALGWTITGVETYGGPCLFRAWVEPSPVRDTTLLLPDQARGIVIQVHADANDFQTAEDADGRLLGYTFAATTPTTRYGFITLAHTFSMALEPTRQDAAAMLPTAVLSDERQAQRPSPAVQRAAAVAAQREKAAADRAAYRAETDDRSAAEAHRHGAPLPPATVDRIAERMAEPEQPGPFKPGDLIVCADGKTRTVAAMAPEFADEPLRVIVEGGAQWIAADCEHARELELHAPDSYTGPRALCGYADHLAPARQDGTMDVHERTPGTMGHCPGSLLTPRAHREELTRRHTTAFSYNPPRPNFLAATAKAGDVVELGGQTYTVTDCQPHEGNGHFVSLVLDGCAYPVQFQVEDRITCRHRVRRHDVRCQDCGVYVLESSDEAADGVPFQRLCGVCDHPDALNPEHRAAVLEEAIARITARAAYASSAVFQPVVADDQDRPVGWTFRTGYGTQAAYGWVTAHGRLISQVGTEYRWQSERAILDHHEAGTLAPTSHDLMPALAARPVAEIRRGLAALRAVDEAPHENTPARRVLEGTIVQHDGATEGCAPRDVEHPDVLAARRALAGLAAARLTDHHDVSEPTEQEGDVRGYMVNPRGQGRVAIYWLEGGEIIRRDTPLHGAALDCLEDRMRRRGWETERMGRSAQCLFAHVPDSQRQG